MLQGEYRKKKHRDYSDHSDLNHNNIMLNEVCSNSFFFQKRLQREIDLIKQFLKCKKVGKNRINLADSRPRWKSGKHLDPELESHRDSWVNKTL